MTKRLFFLVMGLVMVAAPAWAASITIDGNESFTVVWADTAFSPDLRARATFTVTDFSDTGFNLAVSDIRNTTATSPDINARLVSFGFGLDPSMGSVTNVVDGDIYKWGFTNFPEFQPVDICGFSGNSCSGGAFTGLNQGEATVATDIMSIRILGDFSGGEVTFSPIVVRFQTARGSSVFDGDIIDNPPDDPPDDEPPSPIPVPEPATLSLLGVGLAGAAVRRFRKRT